MAGECSDGGDQDIDVDEVRASTMVVGDGIRSSDARGEG
jgi:hypothetical protein